MSCKTCRQSLSEAHCIHMLPECRHISLITFTGQKGWGCEQQLSLISTNVTHNNARHFADIASACQLHGQVRTQLPKLAAVLAYKWQNKRVYIPLDWYTMSAVGKQPLASATTHFPQRFDACEETGLLVRKLVASPQLTSCISKATQEWLGLQSM